MQAPKIVIDLDDTITIDSPAAYADKAPNLEVIARLREYRESGFEIVIHTARNMRTFNGAIGKINAVTLPTIIEWLTRHEVPYDEIHVGKPWCGSGGFYVDDKTIRPSEFVSLTLEEIRTLVGYGAPQ